MIDDRELPTSIVYPPSSISVLPAQLRRRCLVNDEIAVGTVDGDAIDFARSFLRHVAVADVVQDALGVPFQGVAQSAAAGGVEAKDFAGMEHMIGEARGDH